MSEAFFCVSTVFMIIFLNDYMIFLPMLISSNVNQSLKYWMFISNFFDVGNWVESTKTAPFPLPFPKRIHWAGTDGTLWGSPQGECGVSGGHPTLFNLTPNSIPSHKLLCPQSWVRGKVVSCSSSHHSFSLVLLNFHINCLRWDLLSTLHRRG